jgi:hypothetical protein
MSHAGEGIIMAEVRTRADQVRDAIMMAILTIWIIFGLAFVWQLFRDGTKVLDGLPPFWFWGVPLAPFSALYTPWMRSGNAPAGAAPTPPEPPAPTPAPETS